MKMEPKGRNPAAIATICGSKYHFLSGIGRGTTLIRQGMSAFPFKLRPTTAPIKLSGIRTNAQMATIDS